MFLYSLGRYPTLNPANRESMCDRVRPGTTGPQRLLGVQPEFRALQVVATIPIGGAGTFGDLAAASPDRRYVYATFDSGAGGKGGIARVNIETMAVDIWPYPIVGRPHGIAYSTAALEED